jgi:hypothetical protein
LASFSGIFALASVLLAVWANAELTEHEHPSVLLVVKLVSALWALVPPVYFFFEFHWARETMKTEEELKDLQESQKMAQKIWAAVVAALAVIYLKGAMA